MSRANHLRSSAFIEYEYYHVVFTVAIVLSCFIFTRYYVLVTCLYAGYKLLRPVFESLFMTKLDTYGRGVFITGCDTGFGHKLAEVFDELGFVVFASCLDEMGPGAKRLRSIGSKRMFVLEVDVTNQNSIQKAGKFVQKNLPRKGLWAIVNNAGINSMTEVELTPIHMYERYLAVNLYGPIRICKQFLPLIRKTQGRIINLTSVHGRLTLPRETAYEAAKHGVETLSDSLRLEMKKFGVNVSIVEPGLFTTSINTEFHVNRMRDDIEAMWQTSTSDIQKTYKLDDLMTFMHTPYTSPWPPGDELMPVVNAVEHAIRSPVSNSRYLVSGKGKRIRFIDEFVVVAKLYSLLPTWITLEYIAHWFNARQFRL